MAQISRLLILGSVASVISRLIMTIGGTAWRKACVQCVCLRAVWLKMGKGPSQKKKDGQRPNRRSDRVVWFARTGQ
jgi:hypothetical protein